MPKLLIAFIGAMLIASPSLAQPRFGDFIIMGTGGSERDVDDLDLEPRFLWVDTTGTLSAGKLASYGFVPFNAFSRVAQHGSLLLSSPFPLTANETLRVNFRAVSGAPLSRWRSAEGTAPVVFALLLRDGITVAILANVRTDGEKFFNNFNTDIPPSDANFVATSPGVTTRVTLGEGLDVTIGGIRYANPANIGQVCGCFLDVQSTYAPGAGTYQLLVGTYDFLVEPFPAPFNSYAALAIRPSAR